MAKTSTKTTSGGITKLEDHAGFAAARAKMRELTKQRDKLKKEIQAAEQRLSQIARDGEDDYRAARQLLGLSVNKTAAVGVDEETYRGLLTKHRAVLRAIQLHEPTFASEKLEAAAAVRLACQPELEKIYGAQDTAAASLLEAIDAEDRFRQRHRAVYGTDSCRQRYAIYGRSGVDARFFFKRLLNQWVGKAVR